MRRARELVGVVREEWSAMLAIQIRREVTPADVETWELGIGIPPPSDVLLAAAYLARDSIHDLIGSADDERRLTAVEEGLRRLEQRGSIPKCDS
jgi:hypothetical protein